IDYESGLADTADPLGGSYAVEYLTNEIERRAAEYIEKIDEMGGMLAAIEAGYVQREIERAAYDYQRAVEAGEEVVVGVNRFRTKEETAIETLKIDPAFERGQVERVRKGRAERDTAGGAGGVGGGGKGGGAGREGGGWGERGGGGG